MKDLILLYSIGCFATNDSAGLAWDAMERHGVWQASYSLKRRALYAIEHGAWRNLQSLYRELRVRSFTPLPWLRLDMDGRLVAAHFGGCVFRLSFLLVRHGSESRIAVSVN